MSRSSTSATSSEDSNDPAGSGEGRTAAGEASAFTPVPGRPWVGMLLSILVPGFGLIRAGNTEQGIFWLILIQALNYGGLILAAHEKVSAPLALVFVAGSLLVAIWMLVDSFRPGRMTPRLWALFVALFALMICLPDTSTHIARTFNVAGSSMEPTVLGMKEGQEASGGDAVVADIFSYKFKEPQRGDLLVFNAAQMPGYGLTEPVLYNTNTINEKNEHVLIIRIIGLPGENIEIKENGVYANDRKLGVEDGIPAHLKHIAGPGGATKFSSASDSYFVLGDNSANSYDSRFWGSVPKSAIIGKATKIYFPFHRMRVLE